MKMIGEHFVDAKDAQVVPKSDCLLVFLQQTVGDRKAVQAVWIPTNHGRNDRAKILREGRRMLRLWIEENA